MVLDNLSKDGTQESTYVAEAERLSLIETKLLEKQGKLLADIGEILAIPVLPGECKHMKRAVEPLFPSPAWFKNNVKRLWARVRKG